MSEVHCFKIKILVEYEIEVNAETLDDAYLVADDMAREEEWLVRDMWSDEKEYPPLTYTGLDKYS